MFKLHGTGTGYISSSAALTLIPTPVKLEKASSYIIYPALQSEKTAYLESKQLLPFSFALQNNIDVYNLCRSMRIVMKQWYEVMWLWHQNCYFHSYEYLFLLIYVLVVQVWLVMAQEQAVDGWLVMRCATEGHNARWPVQDHAVGHVLQVCTCTFMCYGGLRIQNKIWYMPTSNSIWKPSLISILKNACALAAIAGIFFWPAVGRYPIKFILPPFVSYLGERGLSCVGNGWHFCTPVLMNI